MRCKKLLKIKKKNSIYKKNVLKFKKQNYVKKTF